MPSTFELNFTREWHPDLPTKIEMAIKIVWPGVIPMSESRNQVRGTEGTRALHPQMGGPFYPPQREASKGKGRHLPASLAVSTLVNVLPCFREMQIHQDKISSRVRVPSSMHSSQIHADFMHSAQIHALISSHFLREIRFHADSSMHSPSSISSRLHLRSQGPRHRVRARRETDPRPAGNSQIINA